MKHLSKDTHVQNSIKSNVQNNELNINQISNEKLNCNYANNYYGDQLCLTQPSCNYVDNYYGDQICSTNENNE